MSIIFNQQLSRTHDAMEGLVLSYKSRYQKIYSDYNLTVSKAAEEALVLISDRINFDIPCSDLLFGEEVELAVAFARSRFTPEDITLNSFVRYLEGLSEEQVKLIILRSLNARTSNKSCDVLQSIAQDETLFVSFLSEADIPSSLKWEALAFTKDINANMAAFIKLYKQYLPIYKKIITKNKTKIEQFENKIDQGVQQEGVSYIDKIMHGSVSLNTEEVTVGILFFRSKSVICVTREQCDEKIYVFVGMDFEEAVRDELGDSDLALSIFKHLSDKTRFQILNLLKEGDLYGQEIAEKVGITLATVSYHMNFLLAVNLVKLEKIGQKGYYTLRKESLRKSIEFLQNNFQL